MARIKEQEIFVNPYVVQMDKFAESLQHLSKTFLNMEHYKGTLSKEEIDEMFDKVTGNVCAGCERKEVCLGERREKTYQMMCRRIQTSFHIYACVIWCRKNYAEWDGKRKKIPE